MEEENCPGEGKKQCDERMKTRNGRDTKMLRFIEQKKAETNPTQPSVGE